MDGILHNTSQDDTYDSVGSDAVTGAMDGYNGVVIVEVVVVARMLL